MVTGGGEERTGAPSRRTAIRSGLVLAVLLAAFLGTVAALNGSLYSASGFVGAYLAALERNDLDEALSTPGVETSAGAAATLLTPSALAELSDIRLISDTDAGAGLRRVVYGFQLGGQEGRTEFEVARTGSRLGLFQTWSFRSSPTSVLEILPTTDARFEANGVSVESAGGPGVGVAYDVLIPGAFTLRHESDYLESPPADVLLLEPGSATQASVDAQANGQFVALVQGELDALLDECTEQTVLQPTGCPFGETIRNRVEGTPVWSIADYPDVEILPGATPGTWQVPQTTGAAHLVVDVRSLFDGTLSTFDEDVEFSVGYLITFEPDGRVSIVGQ